MSINLVSELFRLKESLSFTVYWLYFVPKTHIIFGKQDSVMSQKSFRVWNSKILTVHSLNHHVVFPAHQKLQSHFAFQKQNIFWGSK